MNCSRNIVGSNIPRPKLGALRPTGPGKRFIKQCYKLYQGLEQLQHDLDDWFDEYNNKRTHQGKRCEGKTPMQTFLDGLELVEQKNLDTNFQEAS